MAIDTTLIKRARRNLQEYRMAFVDIRFDTALHALPEEKQLRASRARCAAALAILRLDNDDFEQLAAQLASQEDAIKNGIEKLDAALDDLAQAKAVIDAAAAVINVVGEALKLAGVTLPV